MSTKRIPGTDTLRLGFLGVGWIGKTRMKSLIDAGLVEAAIITDVSPENRDQALSLCPVSTSCATLEELVAQAPDGIVIATPSALHADQVFTALRAGIPVF